MRLRPCFAVPKFLLRYNSKIANFRQDVCYGDEILTKKKHVKKSSVGIASGKYPISVTEAASQISTHPIPTMRFPRLSPGDQKFNDALKLASGRTNLPLMNLNEQPILLEGYRLIRDAIRSGGQVLYLLFSSPDILRKIPEHEKIPNVYFVPHRTLKQWSRLKTPPGILALVYPPAPSNVLKTNSIRCVWKPLPVILIIDNIRDPGNLGSLLRTAAGFRLHSVLVSKGSVDVWNDKVVRAGMSAHFHIPIYSDLEWSDISRFFLPAKANPSEPSLSYLPRCFLADISNKVTNEVVIHPSSLPPSPQVENKNEWTEDDETNEESNCELHRPLQLDGTEAALRLPLSQSPHFAVDYFPKVASGCPLSGPSTIYPNIALVVGGEAHGLSPEAYHLAHLTDGSRVYVPIAPETDSLNVLSAASVILGEMQRQYIMSFDD